jgi:paraquat-inducible protein A
LGEEKKDSYYYICKTCSHPILMTNGLTEDVVCDRCGHHNHRAHPKSASWSLAFSMTALILYIPANIYPFMTIEMYGNRNSSTIWGGILSLNESGSWPIALIVFLASMLIPFFKLIILFYLGLTASNQARPQFKAKLYRIVEVIGRWSMLDIFLLAVLVAIMKLGPWTNVRPEIGSLMFALVVIFTMLASEYFDPQLLWENKDGKSSS